MTNVTRTMYLNKGTAMHLSEVMEGNGYAIDETKPIEYVDVAPVSESKVKELSGLEGNVMVTGLSSERIVYGMSISDFIAHGTRIK